MCSPNFLAMFSIPTKVVLFLFHFLTINTISSAYANTFNCSLPIFILLGIIFILCITFCNVKLNNIGNNGYKIFVCFLHMPVRLCRDAGGQERESYWH